ncbi:MAG: hypothetical protein P8P83_03150 [Rickettsiaceae bacterium]|nr:hypothetical protein [Rickettsiaceae bacterium]
MILWGTSSTALKEQFAIYKNCSNCSHGQLVLHGIQTYKHIWFFPLLPYKKVFCLTCPNCEATLSGFTLDSLPGYIREESFKTPKTSYIGWFIILFFIAVIQAINYFSPERPPEIKNYSIHNDLYKCEKGNFLILDSASDKGYIIAHIEDKNDGIISFKLGKYVYKSERKAINIVENRKNSVNNEFYMEEYYDLPIEDLDSHFRSKKVIIPND